MLSMSIDHRLACWETLEKSLVADASPWLKLFRERVRLPDGRTIDEFYTIEQRDFVAIFAMSGDEQVLTLWHYKHGPRRVNLGIPAGIIEPGESAESAARRELREETGFEAQDWVKLGAFSVDGNRGCGAAHLFVARDLTKQGEPTFDDLEETRLEWMSTPELATHLFNGDVATLGAAATISTGLLWLRREQR
ncbi:MAG: NUDIX hydrolase [Polyangiales bacterium]